MGQNPSVAFSSSLWGVYRLKGPLHSFRVPEKGFPTGEICHDSVRGGRKECGDPGHDGKGAEKIRSGAYWTAQEIGGKADAEATRIYGLTYSRDTDLYTFYKTLETYGAASTNNAYIILSTDNDYYKYLKKIWK